MSGHALHAIHGARAQPRAQMLDQRRHFSCIDVAVLAG
jgi:hypothetical protein